MDANKLKVLREISYTIQPSCETCSNSDLSLDGWGYCGVHTYEHLKHNEDSSFASVHRLGSCLKWERDEQKISLLGLHAFHEFLPAQPTKPTKEPEEAVRPPMRANIVLRAMMSDHVFVEGEWIEMIHSNPVDWNGSVGTGDPPNGTLGVIQNVQDHILSVLWNGFSAPQNTTRFQVRPAPEFTCPDQLCLGRETSRHHEKVICERCQAIGCDACVLYDMPTRQYICDNCYGE